ncbi:hypothetical protein KBC79_06050 [Candidatus Woesebacteria bacterium]|nr:hypothetical protein [Candidatus Woesebacteria bacterium]
MRQPERAPQPPLTIDQLYIRVIGFFDEVGVIRGVFDETIPENPTVESDPEEELSTLSPQE